MANTPRISAKFDTQLSLKVNVGDTTFTLESVADADGTALPNGLYGFTVDEGNSSFEYFEATLDSTAGSGVKSFTVTTLTETTGFTKAHRAGAEVKITDFTILGKLEQIFRGTRDLDSATPLAYDAAPTLSSNEQLATVGYVLSVVTGGAVTFDKNVIVGAAGEALASGDWVYLKESDGRWYKADASDKTKSKDVLIGKALGAQSTVGDNVPNGIFIGGLETTGTYVAGTKYYLSNTAGQASTSAGDNEVLLGVGDENTDLVFLSLYDPEALTADEKDAAAGTVGTPSSTNKYVTDNNLTSYGDDQTQTTDDGAIAFGEADTTTNNNKIAQSFKPTKAKIRGVKLRKEADTGTFTGTVTVALQLDSSGNPDGTDLASVTLTNSAFGVAVDEEIEALFSSEYTMDTTKTYWIVISSSTSDNSNHPNISVNSAGGYANGTIKYNNTTDGWVEISGQDLYFKTLEGVNDQVVETDEAGKIKKDFFDRAKMPTPIYPQIYSEYTTSGTGFQNVTFCSDPDKDSDVFFSAHVTSGVSVQIRRWVLEDWGEFRKTHAVTQSMSGTASPPYIGMCIVGDYVYVFWRDSGASNALKCYRFDKADGANATLMTLPSITIADVGMHVWTNGTFIYVNPENSTTTTKLSISGTTLSSEGTGTTSTSISNVDDASSIVFDGTTNYLVYGNSSSLSFVKWTDEYGTSVTTDSESYTLYGPRTYQGTSNIAENKYCAINIDDDLMYIIWTGIFEQNASGDLYGFTLYPYKKSEIS